MNISMHNDKSKVFQRFLIEKSIAAYIGTIGIVFNIMLSRIIIGNRYRKPLDRLILNLALADFNLLYGYSGLCNYGYNHVSYIS